jgi:hypothetical protein
MYISNFSTINNEDYIDRAVGISAYPARNLIRKVEYIPELAPKRDMLKKFNEGEISYTEYFDAYLNKISGINLSIFRELEDKILCCHCKEVLKCHRSWLSFWYEEQTGLLIPELGTDLKKLVEEFEKANGLC